MVTRLSASDASFYHLENSSTPMYVGTLSIQTRKNNVKLTFDDAVKWLTEHGLGAHVEAMEKDVAASKPTPPPSRFPVFRSKNPTKKLTTDV